MLNNGEKWLRYLLENQLYNFPGCVWCRKCDIVIISGGKRCSRCKGKTLPIQFDKVSAIIRRAYQKDKSLLKKVVWNHLSLQPPDRRTSAALPEFPEPFSWLNESLKDVKRPKGRPSDIHENFIRVVRIQLLRGKLMEGLVNAEPEELYNWAVDEREMKRWIAFYERYRSNPEIRLRGERARRKKRSKRRIRNKRSARRGSRHS